MTLLLFEAEGRSLGWKALWLVRESASRHGVVMESTSGIKEAGEQSAVVAAPMKRCEGLKKHFPK